MYLHTPALEAGSWWRVDTASGSDTATTVYAHDGTDAIPTALGTSGSTVRGNTRDGTAVFWSASATLYCKELTYQGVPTGTVVTSTGGTPAAPGTTVPVDIATISTAVAALPTTYVKLLVTDATSAVLTGTLVAGHLSPVDCTVGPGIRTLPAASSVAVGTPTVAKKADTTTNTLTVQRAGSDLIFGTGAGSTSKTLTLSGEAVTFVSNGVDRWSVESSDTPSGAIAAGYAPIAATPVASSATSGTLTAGAEHNLTPTSAATWTLPTGVAATKLPTTVKNNGTATVTVARGGSDTINGGTTSVSIAATEWARFTSDGAGAWTQSGTAGQSGTYAQVVKPEAYGAKGDGKYLSDGVMDGATAVLTSASAPFASGDVGKIVRVGGAGAAGVPLSGTIASYQSATQVTLSAASATAVSAAYVLYGTDDTTAINSAVTAWLTARPGYPGDIQFAQGKVYAVGTGILVHPAVISDGGRITGYGAEIVYTGTDPYALTISTSTDDGALVGAWRKLSISGLRVTGGGIRMKSGAGAVSALYGFDIADVEANNFLGHGIWVDGAFEYVLRNARLVADASNTTNNCINIPTNGAASDGGVTSSGDIIACTTRKGKYGLYGIGADIHVFGGTYIQTQNEGIYLDNCVGDLVSGVHIEDSWKSAGSVTSGNAGLRMIGQGTVQNVHVVRNAGQGNAANCVRVYSSNHIDIIGPYSFGTVNDLFIDGGNNSSVTVHGSASYVLGGGYSTPGSNGKMIRVGANASSTKVFTMEGGARLSVTGSQNGNPAIGSLLTQLAGLGLITDSTTAGALTADLITAPSNATAPLAPSIMKTGEATYDPRQATGNCTTASQRLLLTYFTALRTETINNVGIATNATAAASTPTLCRVGIYTVDASDNLTLVASIASDTALFASASTGYTRALSAPLSKVAGQRYAVGVLVVTGVATPTFCGNTPLNGSGALVAMGSNTPRRQGQATGQADLPSSLTAGSVGNAASGIYFELTP